MVLPQFDWSRPVPVQTQPAILQSAAHPNQLTFYINEDCTRGQNVCHFSSVLFADFYRSKGTASGTGQAQLQFETTRRRLGEKEGRKLQEDEAACY